MLEHIMRGIAGALSNYGIWAAGLFSGHGIFEENVPSELIMMVKER